MLEQQDLENLRTIVREETRGQIKTELKEFHEQTLMPAFGQFTEEVILPAVERMIKEVEVKVTTVDVKVDNLDETMKKGFYGLDRRMEQLEKAIRAEQERDELFKTTVVGILERSKLANAEEVNLLKNLITQKI